MSPKPDVSEQRKNQIIEAAIKVFSKEGFHKARMDDIADEAGLSKGALYWYFKSKDKIISSILNSLFEREFDQLQAWSINEGSARATLEKIGLLVVDDLLSARPLMPIIFEFWAMSLRSKAIGNTIRNLMWRYVEVIVPIIEKGVDSGEFREIDSEDAAMAFGAVLEGSILLWSYDMNKVDFRDLISKSVSIFLDGIVNQT